MTRYVVVTASNIPAVEWAWQRQSVWSQTANQLKAGPARQRAARLTLTVAAAALALAGSQIKAVSEAASTVLVVVAAVALAGAGLLSSRANPERTRDWTRARSVSEALKTEVYLYLSQAGPYTASDRDRLLEAEVQRLEGDAGDLLRHASGLAPKDRGLPDVRDVDTYLKVRVRQSQLAKYYVPKAREMRQRLRLMKAVEVTLALAAAALSALAVVSADIGAWAAVATTAAGAVAAYIAAERFEFLWIEYSRTASELQRLADRRTAPDGTPLSGADLAVACEQVISVQNQAWMAKWGEENAGDDK